MADSSSRATIIAQFVAESGEKTGTQLNLPVDTTTSQLEILINHLLSNEDKTPYSFFINETEILGDVRKTLEELKVSQEEVLNIVYQPQAVFRVKSITRCAGSMTGHTEAVLNVGFSPDGNKLATGSGDTTVRIWDVDTQTPAHTLTGHTNWVLYVSFSPDGKKLATGGMDTSIRIWDPETGKPIGQVLRGHSKYITGIAWEPLHLNPKCERLASSSKDGSVKIWDIVLGRVLRSLTSHTMSVTAVRWSGENFVYSASQDRTIKVWNPDEGKLVRNLEGHSHWVNTLALNTDYVLRTGSYDHTGKEYTDIKEAQNRALERYNEVLKSSGGIERLVSGSDDLMLYLWEGSKNKKPIARMNGHQQVVNLVSYSPDGRIIASASFDKSIKIWNGLNGKGHIEAVYQVSWSSDSRLLVSGSKDSTLKVWDTHTKKMKFDLPGHGDEVYSVDWAPDGQRVASGAKDKIVKIWRN